MQHLEAFSFFKRKDMKDDKTFPHRSQSKGYNCGPTSIRIIADFLKYPESITDEYIEKISGTNTQYGCTDVNMARGLNTLGIKNKRIVNDTEEVSMTNLKQSLKNGFNVVLRTLTKGIKHWIVVYKFDKNLFYCSDPWLGKITYTYDQIVDIWKPRDFDAFIIEDKGKERPIIENIEEKDIPIIIEMVADEFERVMSKQSSYSYLKSAVNWKISVKLTLKGKIIGCYLLAERNFHRKELDGLKGIEGVALCLLSKYRNLGYGKMLMSYTENLPYDYIWGQHLKGLNNMNNWERRRDYIFDYGNSYMSLKMLR